MMADGPLPERGRSGKLQHPVNFIRPLYAAKETADGFSGLSVRQRPQYSPPLPHGPDRDAEQQVHLMRQQQQPLRA